MCAHRIKKTAAKELSDSSSGKPQLRQTFNHPPSTHQTCYSPKLQPPLQPSTFPSVLSASVTTHTCIPTCLCVLWCERKTENNLSFSGAHPLPASFMACTNLRLDMDLTLKQKE
ncbi:hypothetical protein E3N88_08840 [Mikania micrantha]|uniref:Uncharacterized protein n=1 Tax=Mikania micrantha TaxID=192012 RepID=A0A5N6PHG1_9ASTR|nr:hypothetical protein E3N88_08840 [Mikania micrantha]